MTMDDGTFTARTPDGEIVRLRVKGDIRKLGEVAPSERLVAMLKMFPGSPDQPVRPRRYHEFLTIFKAAADDDDEDEIAREENGNGGDDGGGDNLADHPAVQMTRLLVASGRFGDHGQALDYLLNTAHGQALLARMKAAKTAKETPHMDTIHSIMKDGSIAATCAAIVAKGATTISEAELVEAVGKIAAERWPELSPAQAFSKIYTASSDEARVLQHALSVAKASEFDAFAPTQVGGAAAQDTSDQSEAIAQLRRLGQQKYPNASASDQFERALVDPANHALARRAVPRPQPTTSFPMPR